MIHLDVIVADTATLLDPVAYGVGALLRWERCATVDGVYVEGGTVALVADVSLYDVWDSAGTVGTWYRTRISDAAASTFSGYTVPYQTTEQGLYLSAGQVRGFGVGGTLDDEQLLILLGAAAQDIVRVAGPMGDRIEILSPGPGDLLLLSRAALSISSIVERTSWATTTTLTADDYALNDDLLRRLSTGTHPAYSWAPRVTVTYQPVDELASRQRVQLALVRQDLGYSPGLSSTSIGEWSESYGSAKYQQERADILASLNPGVAAV